nr:permease [Neisseria meningitidis]
MSFSIALPLVYLFIGILIGKTPFRKIKGTFSVILSRWIIPFVIVYNITTYRDGMQYVMLWMIISMGLIILIGKRVDKYPVWNLCLCYLNIGWLGLPIVATLFGDEAAQVLISAYVGSSLFGNSVGVGLLLNNSNFISGLKKTLKSPPVVALVIGMFGIPLGHFVADYFGEVYFFSKIAMGILGMVILGIWLAEIKLNLNDLKKSIKPFLIKNILFIGIVFLFIQIAAYFDLKLILENQKTLYLIPLLPPAANIIVLETAYLKTGRSASMIAYGTIFSLIAISIYILLVQI